jgi:hypothetical protein
MNTMNTDERRMGLYGAMVPLQFRSQVICVHLFICGSRPLPASLPNQMLQNVNVTATRRRNPTEEISFEPVDNARLAALCGPLDANLRQIENALDVPSRAAASASASRGPKEKATQAARALRRFYDQAGADLTVEDIQLGLVEIAARRAQAPRRKRRRCMIPRRAELTARTPRQAQYLQQMRAIDITFCVGPRAPARRSSRWPPRSMRSSATR